jgi:preprotein translocase subunit SecE
LALAFVVAAAGIVAYYYLGDKPQLLRVAVLLAGFAAGAVMALQSDLGRAAFGFAKESRAELRRVVWPARKETIQMTGVVIAMVIAVALFLWVVDWVLTVLVKLLTGQGA